jgi:hypothetical protein
MVPPGAGQVIRSIRGFSNDWYVIVSDLFFSCFVATTLFSVIKNSLNQIWLIGVKETPGPSFQPEHADEVFRGDYANRYFCFFADLVFDSLGTIASQLL